MIKQEWKSIWKDKKYFLSIIVMFVMPLMYCGMLLYAFWDPYGQLDQLPVAVINEDKGAVIDNTETNLGDDLLESLLESPNFKYIEVSKSEAEQMLQDGDVYISIAIPENFSKHATTMLDANPEKLIIEYKVNEAVNYLSSKIGDSAINQIRAEVNEEVSKTYAEQLFEAISTLGNGYGEAAEGAIKLKDGVFDLKSGSKDLEGYLQQLASSTVTLKNGTSTLADGVTTAKEGAQKLVEGTKQLGAGSEQLANGAHELQQGVNGLASGMTSYTAGVADISTSFDQLVAGQQGFHNKLAEATSSTEQLSTGASSVADGTEKLATGIVELSRKLEGLISTLPAEQQHALKASLEQLTATSKQIASGAEVVDQGMASLSTGTQQLVAGHATIVENSEKIAAGLNKLTGSSTPLEAGTAQLEAGFSTLASKLTEFNTGIDSVVGGIESLRDGLVNIDSGSKKLADGTKALSEKSIQLADGSTSLVEGTDKLANGATDLELALRDARDEANVNVTASNYDMVASPVEVDKNIQNKVENYGTGLSPYFIALGLFVGALLLTNVYNYVQPSIPPINATRWFISKSSVPFVVWIFQTVILTLVLLYGLKLNVTNITLFIVLMAVISFTFITIIQLLVVLFGDVGKLIGLIFLIVQLSSSAGTFPVELLPKVFQSMYDYMPMSYAVEALRHIISSTNYDLVKSKIVILLIIGAVCLALSYSYFQILYVLRYRKKAVQEQI